MGTRKAKLPEIRVPLSQEMVNSANHLSDHFQGWQFSDRVFQLLHRLIPEYTGPAIFLKTITINKIASTNLLAVGRMVKHIEDLATKFDFHSSTPRLIDQIASLPMPSEGKVRRHTSFASKFGHFFIDRQQFPIFDRLALRVLKKHFGRGAIVLPDEAKYQTYVSLLDHLQYTSGVTATYSQLDRYLWLTGTYWNWRANKKVHLELSELFSKSEANEFRTVIDKAFATGK